MASGELPTAAPNIRNNTKSANGTPNTQGHILGRGTLAPQYGQAFAVSLRSLPHSLHVVSAIRYTPLLVPRRSGGTSPRRHDRPIVPSYLLNSAPKAKKSARERTGGLGTDAAQRCDRPGPCGGASRSATVRTLIVSRSAPVRLRVDAGSIALGKD